MKKLTGIIVLVLTTIASLGQKKTISQMKADIEHSGNSPLYVKDVLKKKFRLDTVTVLRINHFKGIPDSLAYHGKVGKVYGPYENGKILLQILAKAPNTFNRVSQIFLDSKVFSRHFADSLADDIISRINAGNTTFEDKAQTLSMGGEAVTKGDLGWVAAGGMLPAIEQELAKRKKGEIFKMYSSGGVHIIRKTDTREDTGFALILRIFL